MSSKQELTILKGKRDQYRRSLARINEFVCQQNDGDITDIVSQQLIVRREKSDDLLIKYSDIDAEIKTFDKKDQDQIESFEELYYNVQSKINVLISKSNLGQAKTPGVDCDKSRNSDWSQGMPSTRLPYVNIPAFNGVNLDDYKPFQNLFLAIIHKNKCLSEVEKLFYLRSYLKGEALALISNLELTDESYKEALKLLDERYNNEALLVSSHIYKILDMPPVVKGTSSSLREFVSLIKQQVTALKNLGEPTDAWNSLLVCLLSRKLDSHTNKCFQLDRDNSKLSTLNEFLQYLENRALALESVTTAADNVSRQKVKVSHVTVNNKSDKKCKFCLTLGHKLYQCQNFKLESYKSDFILKNKICIVCLNAHSGKCRFKFKCQICSSSEHNSILCNTNNVVQHKVGLVGRIPNTTVLLPTVKFRVKTKDNQYSIVRGLIDSGSEVSLITQQLAKQLGHSIDASQMTLVGVTNGAKSITESVTIKIESCIYNFSMEVTCHIIDNITCMLPHLQFESSKLIPSTVQLSDNAFNTPGTIDVLLGANIFFSILLTGTIKLGCNNLVLQNTFLGYVVSGEIPEVVKNKFMCNNAVSLCIQNNTSSVDVSSNLENIISKFWECERVPQVIVEYDNDQAACEQSFRNSVCRINNRFQVELPLKKNAESLNIGDTFSVAHSRFLNLEKRLHVNPELFGSYKQFIDEYVALGHAKILNLGEIDVNNPKDAIETQRQLISILNLGSFKLHKWSSNSETILKEIPTHLQHLDDKDFSRDFSQNNFVIKALGLEYNVRTDNFEISVPRTNFETCVTKRQILSAISKLWDPMGICGPILVESKLIMQKLWLAKLKWDEVVSDELLDLWKKFSSELAQMEKIILPRNLKFTGASSISLIGFCDSSIYAYGAVIYTQTIKDEKIHINLLCSKSRIAPINKKLSIPRLELNSALLLSNLINKIFLLLKNEVSKVYLYSDSNIVLAWIKNDPINLNPYVANRITKIQSLTRDFKWGYVPSKQNPADCLSRGVSPLDLKLDSIWFTGPDFVKNNDISLNLSKIPQLKGPLPEQKKKVMVVNVQESKTFFTDFSNLCRLQRVTAYILRFAYNL
ncbi:uncharacterized protein LOC126893046 [Diabrotica virgifera virgifera]|uniref:Peptidase aspartic putative domain-containing protein n=1 Tax=Diabrotica virgifera virgifera TaxID=50390 RepID=A0ABM5L926_DIAVI|nr:uncharacterized protein LOC126893046 [Diabrotica virgifera virgifera]